MLSATNQPEYRTDHTPHNTDAVEAAHDGGRTSQWTEYFLQVSVAGLLLLCIRKRLPEKQNKFITTQKW